MPATVVVRNPVAPPPPPKDINYATWIDATRVANDLVDSKTVTEGEVVVYEGTVQDVGGAANTGAQPDSLPLLISFTIKMPFTNELGVLVLVDVPFKEVAGELVNELDTKPNAKWVPSIVAGSTQATVAGDMERR